MTDPTVLTDRRAQRSTTHKSRRPSFVEKTIAGIASSIEQAIFTEEHARKHAFLQQMDPRAKLVAFILVILSVSLALHSQTIVLLYACTLAAAVASQLPMSFYVKRVWLGIPLFAGIVVIPAIFLTPGQPILHIPLGLTTWTATREGLAGAVIFVLRVGASVSLAVLLVLTTKWADLLKSLRILRVPSVFMLVLSMTYRYVFLFLHTVNSLFIARKSRTIARTGGNEQRRWVVASMSTLIGKSFRMSSEVYQAMLSRGFRGEVYAYDDYAMRRQDWMLVAAAALLAAVVTILDRWYFH
jgi:cobalt/nickel transport system permease protein